MRNPGHHSRDLDKCIRVATADCASVIELGCMFGDRLNVCAAPQRTGIDAHGPYIDAARDRYPSTDFVHGDARDIAHLLATVGAGVDAVLMIDFLEHLIRPDAHCIIADATRIARKRIVMFVPLGHHPQTTDVHGFYADHWQTHRSTWEPLELTEMGFEVATWEHYHDVPGKDHRAAFAIHEVQ